MSNIVPNISLDNISEALPFISPDIPRDEWVQLGMALKHELGKEGFELFDSWSSAGQSYKQQDALSAWNSFHGDGVTIRTVYKMARDNGYKPRTNGQECKPIQRPPEPKETPEQATQRRQKDARKREKALAYWDKGKPCKSHPYLTRKGVSPHGLRVLNGSLLVPIYNDDWKIVSVQIIQPDGTKRFLKGCKVAGGRFAIGEVTNNKLVIAKAYATAASIHQATGLCVAIGFSSGNLPKVAATARKKKPELRIILAPDNDESGHAVKTAEKAALKYDCEMWIPQFPNGVEGTDFNDLHQHVRAEEVKRQFKNNRYRPEPEAGKGLQPTKDRELLLLRLNDTPVVGALMQNPTEDNVALAFRERHAGEFIYIHGRGKWFQWDGKRWCEDQLHVSSETVRKLARAYNVKGGASAARHGFVRGCLGFAQADPAFARLADDFDNDNYLLNCPDGTWNLLKGERHDHDPGDNITLITAVSPSSDPGGVFLKFLNEIFANDQELIDWLQTALGACLSGAIEDHWILFWIGAGRNGKNTLGDLIAHILGEYAKAIPSDTLMSKKNAEHKTEIANLQGCRLAVASETEEGDFWAESKLKSLTGDAMLSGRYMRQDFIHFRRTHKHLIYGNHRPQLRCLDKAIRSRLKVVPFNVSFDGREDAMLPEKLLTESGSVLHWLMEGHKQWIKQGRKVGTCEAIIHETADYFAMQATIESWIDENCIIVQIDDRPAYQWAKVKDLYSNFKTWCDEANIGTPSLTRFGEKMKNSGFEKVQSNGYRYKGIEVKF